MGDEGKKKHANEVKRVQILQIKLKQSYINALSHKNISHKFILKIKHKLRQSSLLNDTKIHNYKQLLVTTYTLIRSILLSLDIQSKTNRIY